MLQEKKRAAKRSELFLCICGLCAALKSAASSAGIWLPAPANETQPQKKLLSSFIAAPTTAAAFAGRGCSLLLEGFYCEAACR